MNWRLPQGCHFRPCSDRQDRRWRLRCYVPPALVVLPEGADRASRERHAVHAAKSGPDGRERERGLQAALACRQVPVLRDEKNCGRLDSEIDVDHRIPGGHYPGASPADSEEADRALTVRARSRFNDLATSTCVTQKVITDRSAGRAKRHVRRRARTWPSRRQPGHHRQGHGQENLGHRRRLHDGRLCRRAELVLHQQSGEAVGRNFRQCALAYLDRLVKRAAMLRS